MDSTNKGQVMTSSIPTKMFVCMGGSLRAVYDACEFDDDLIRHFHVFRRANGKMSSTKMGPFWPGGMNLEIYIFRLTHPIDTIIFRHLRYDVITWKREGSTGQRRVPLTKG